MVRPFCFVGQKNVVPLWAATRPTTNTDPLHNPQTMSNTPLAERLRPQSLDEYIGQSHLVGTDGVIRRFVESGNIPSFILWGPPGVGKITLAKLVALAFTYSLLKTQR